MKVFSPELERVLEEADAELGARTERNQRWGIADYPDWLLDQAKPRVSAVGPLRADTMTRPSRRRAAWRSTDSAA